MGIRMSGIISGLDTESIVKELMTAQNMKKTKIENKITKHEWKQEKWKDMNAKIYSFYTGSLSKLKTQGTFLAKKATSSNETKVSVKASSSAVEGSHSVKVNQLASSQYVTSGEIKAADEDGNLKKLASTAKLSVLGLDSGTVKIATDKKEYEFEITADSTLGDFVNAFKEAGVSASYDAGQGRLFINSATSGAAGAFSITSSDADLSKLGLADITYTRDDATGAVTYNTADLAGTDIALIGAKDSEIVYNDAVIKGSSNTITANGMTFNLNDVTGAGETITLSVSKDTDSVYDAVKSVLKEYNTLLEELNEAYDAKTARGYEPLTDDEREAMTEEQVEKWETKIKDSLLRRDPLLSGIMQTMRDAFSGSVSYNGRNYSLSSFGVSSKDYTEKGKLHIAGDKDDPETADATDKLRSAIEEDPEAVMEVFTKLSQNMYDELGKKMKATTLSSALTLYNDKQMKKELELYESDLKELEKKLAEIEERYYKQFTAMEKAMASVNSQGSSLASMMGTSTQG